VVQRDIRLARKAQIHEEQSAKDRGILTNRDRERIEAHDAIIAEEFQQQHIQR